LFGVTEVTKYRDGRGAQDAGILGPIVGDGWAIGSVWVVNSPGAQVITGFPVTLT
jgi:hypothetical protein